MESFIFVEKKQRNNKDYYLISNYSHSLVLDESTLKNKLLSGDIVVSNLNINNSRLVEIPNTTKFFSEKELFFLYLSEMITLNCNTDMPMKVVVSKLKEINKRKTQFDNDKDTVKSCLLLLHRFFDYLGKTEFKFMGSKYTNMLHLDKLEYLDYKLASSSYIKIDKTLSKYIQDGTLRRWIDNRTTDVYCYEKLVDCLDKLYRLSYSEDRQKKISAVLEVLGVYFDEVKPNLCGSYLYGYYMLQISEGCIRALKSHTDLQIPPIDLIGRKVFLRESAGWHDEQYKRQKKQILNNSRHFNKMVRKYGKDTRNILDCLVVTPTISANDMANLNNVLKKYTNIIEERYNGILLSLIKLCKKNNNTDVVSILEGLCDLSGCIEIPELPSIGNSLIAITGVAKIGVGARDIMKHGLESFLNDNLFAESQELLKKYKDLSVGQQGTLLYVLDSVRLQLIEKQSLEKRKKLRLYSNMSIIPLIDSMLFKSDWIWRGKSRGGFLEKELRGIEISWLTTYYIMNEKVDTNVVYIRKNNALISWKFFVECVKIYIPDVKQEDLGIYKGMLMKQYHWNIEEDKEINLFTLLKKD